MGTDGDVSIGYTCTCKEVLEAYNKEHPEEMVNVDFQGSVEDELYEVVVWLDSILDRFYTVDTKKRKKLKYAHQASQQKVFHYRFEMDKFFLGFYVMNFRCSDGGNFRDMDLDQFQLSDHEKRTLDEALGVVGCETSGRPLKVAVQS
ncbi:unnamed protein product [Durusdinium trenchii]|uniref:Uncharacterized protein n=1 Tax=Durusdinium trenchii TaxID=1381693 RepID=A0ABP0PCJ4_9DINO